LEKYIPQENGAKYYMSKKIVTFLVSTFLFPVPFVFGEKIVFKSGKTIEGKIIDKTDESVKVDISGVAVTYYFGDIKTIDGKDVNSSSPDKAAPEPAFLPEKQNAEKTTNALSASEKKDVVISGVSGDARYNRTIHQGNILANQGRYNEAAKLFEEAIKINSGFPEGYVDLACMYNHLGRFEEAIAMSQKALKIDPDNAAAYNNIGYSYDQLGKYQEAKNYFLKAKELYEKQGMPEIAKQIEESIKYVEKSYPGRGK